MTEKIQQKSKLNPISKFQNPHQHRFRHAQKTQKHISEREFTAWPLFNIIVENLRCIRMPLCLIGICEN